VHTIKKAKRRGIQTYLCKQCGSYFSGTRRTKIGFITQLWKAYVFHKQTVRELAELWKKDKRTIKKHLESYTPKEKKHRPRAVHILADATYFGERKRGTCWCVVVARDQYTKENLWWRYVDHETTSIYVAMRQGLETQGYTILSVTGDGFSGIRTAFSGIPFQMCHIHMERIVTIGTTQNPKLEAGIILLALVRSIKNTNSHVFRTRLRAYVEQYRDSLNEKTQNPETGALYWTHAPLRKATQALMRLERFLFTYKKDKCIPKTTNSLEGHFRHINEVVAVHCGLQRPQKEKVLDTLLLAGTVAPSQEIIKEIL
jgi:hypothetical protein